MGALLVICRNVTYQKEGIFVRPKAPTYWEGGDGVQRADPTNGKHLSAA